MGLLIDGQWHDQSYDTRSTGGRFVRQDSAFREWVTADGASGFAAVAGRYHLYVSLACPWAHRTLIARRIKGLEEAVSVSVVHPLMLENGWELPEGSDPVNTARFLYEIYLAADPDYTGRVTVPVLWDKERATIVNNESADIVRMFNNAFSDIATGPDLYPEALRGEIDTVNERVYATVNNGVYKAGFATGQRAYDEAVEDLFKSLDWLEDRLAQSRWLVESAEPTEADWRLFTTLIRFDAVYHGHFKCNLRRIRDYPNLWGYLCDLYQMPGIAETVDMGHIKRHYYGSHPSINPTGIVPKGPPLDFTAPHGRARLGLRAVVS